MGQKQSTRHDERATEDDETEGLHLKAQAGKIYKIHSFVHYSSFLILVSNILSKNIPGLAKGISRTRFL